MSGFKITTITAYVAVGPDGDEGVIAVLINGAWMPLIGADEERMKSAYPMATAACVGSDKTFRVLQFHFAEDITEKVKQKYE